MGNKAKIAGFGTAAVVAAAGAYFLSGKVGAKNRKMISGWVLKMKGEVLEKVENLKEMNADAYHRLVDQVAEHYVKVKGVNSSELGLLVKELKSFWSAARFARGNGNGKIEVTRRLKVKTR